MEKFIYRNSFFTARNINRNNILLETNINIIQQENVSKYLNAIITLVSQSTKDIISDISKVESIDLNSLDKIYSEISKINQTGRKIKLVISETRPTIKYSKGNPITKLDMYLSTEEALDGLKI